jgi:molecular chaperone GrpE
MNRTREVTQEPEYLDVDRELPQPHDGAEPSREQAPSAPARAQDDGSQSELEDLRSERDALLERVARNQAEFENIRKRMEREQQAFRGFALSDALRSLLPTVDSLERALQTPAHDPEEFRRGLDLIRQQLDDALRKLGLRRIPTAGEPFDPQLHEAVGLVETPGNADSHIVQEVQGGYMLGDRLLRPARVLVARNQES